MRALIAALVLLATTAVAQTTTLHCPSGCLPNVGGPDIGANGFQKPRTCSCNWDTALQSNIDLLNATAFLPAGVSTSGDATTALNAMTSAKSLTGGKVTLANGTYTISGPIKLSSGMVVEGEGCAFDGLAWHGTIIKMTGTGGYCAFQSATPATCTGGSGSCAVAIGAGTKGPGCSCYANGDCQSSTCTIGTAIRGVVIRNLCIQIQVDHSCGVDFLGMSESEAYDMFIFADAPSATDVTAVRFSDANGTFSGYSDSVHNIKYGGTSVSKTMAIGMDILPQANNTTIRETRGIGNLGTGIMTEEATGIFTGGPTLNTHIRDNAIETFTVAAIKDQAKGTSIDGNYCESGTDTTLPCIWLNNSTSAQIRYNFYTPSGLTTPFKQTGTNVTLVQWNNESNVVDTSKWTNSLTPNFDIQDLSFSPRASAIATCVSNQVGRTYYSNVQHTLCRCDTFNGTLKWCPIECDTSGPTCSPATFLCGAGQTATTCG